MNNKNIQNINNGKKEKEKMKSKEKMQYKSDRQMFNKNLFISVFHPC
jgi:hypothetical protein